MLTTVILDGPMGKRFGKKWELFVNSPAEALRIIEVNKPGLRSWIMDNAAKNYTAYKVKCTYEDGRSEFLNDDTYVASRKLKSIRFTPVVDGAGAAARIVVGALMIVASYFIPPASPYLFNAGVSMIIGGVIQALSPQPKIGDKTVNPQDMSSNYFDGPVNTTAQGAPVPLIYGRVLTGSRTISAQVSIDEAPTVPAATVNDGVNNAPPENLGEGTGGSTGLPDVGIGPGDDGNGGPGGGDGDGGDDGIGGSVGDGDGGDGTGVGGG